MTLPDSNWTAAVIVGVIIGLVDFFRGGWKTPKAIQGLKHDAEYSCRAVADHEQRLTNVEKHTKCPPAPTPEEISRRMERQDRVHARHQNHKP